ncbi:hypothetical protein FOXB_00787 [Fusarium oxysporum f. sp. conglutinans Fo5176]|uniref:SUN domain-containing protein n=1 Tax=Fusarium oxysporum (strain Fo5176) TaxID=660025 RepID=F9F312_FUSOF|nr:hypothetical protein FOXB_00787 [Fusarium oxysporum f. sp. conglutinans Fo5176]
MKAAVLLFLLIAVSAALLSICSHSACGQHDGLFGGRDYDLKDLWSIEESEASCWKIGSQLDVNACEYSSPPSPLGRGSGFWWMSSVANPASDVIIVIGREPDASSGGYHRPQRKRVRTTKVLEMEKQNGDMEWQEEGETSEGALGQNRVRKQTAPKSAGGMVEAIHSLKQLLEQDFNKKIESMKAEFQLEFTKLRDHMAEEVARATAQMAQELSQVRDQLTQVCGELEQIRLQLDTLNKTETPRSSVQTYADTARMTPPSISSQSSTTVRSATPEQVFCTVDTSRVPEDHIGDATPTMIQIQKIKAILETRNAPGARVLRDQLYPIKVDNMNRMVVFDQEFNVLPGAMEISSQENEVQIAKVAWLSRKVNPKAYGSMVVYLTKSTDARDYCRNTTFSLQMNRHIRVYLSRPLDLHLYGFIHFR